MLVATLLLVYTLLFARRRLLALPRGRATVIRMVAFVTVFLATWGLAAAVRVWQVLCGRCWRVGGVCACLTRPAMQHTDRVDTQVAASAHVLAPCCCQWQWHVQCCSVGDQPRLSPSVRSLS